MFKGVAIAVGLSMLIGLRRRPIHQHLAFWRRWDPSAAMAWHVAGAVRFAAVAGALTVLTVEVLDQAQGSQPNTIAQIAVGCALAVAIGLARFRVSRRPRTARVPTHRAARWIVAVRRWCEARADASARVAVARAIGEYRAVQLTHIAFGMWRDHVAPTIEEPDAAFDSLTQLSGLMSRVIADGDDALGDTKAPDTAAEHLRRYMVQMVLAHPNAHVPRPTPELPPARGQFGVQATTAVAPLLGPAAAFLTIIVVAAHIAAGRFLSLTVAAVAGVWTASAIVRRIGRRNLLNDLLVVRAVKVSRLDIAAYGLDVLAEAAHPPTERLHESLTAPRLVVLRGQAASGRTKTALAGLIASCPNHTVLVPDRNVDAGQPPLTKLLSGRVVPWSGSYVLWLGNIATLMEAGFDPRIVERWLVAGRDRIAVATIQADDFARLRQARSPATLALEGATFVDVAPARDAAETEAAERRYRRLEADEPDKAALIRLVAAVQLLELPRRSEADYQQLAQDHFGFSLPAAWIDQMCAGPSAPLIRREETLIANPRLMTIVNDEFPKIITSGLLSGLERSLNLHGLLQAGYAYASRRRFDEGEALFKRAREIAPLPMRPAITRAVANLFETSSGAGATLGNPGGFDFAEPMSPQQRWEIEDQLPATTDGFFDPELTDDPDGTAERFYRLRLRRAFVRAFALMILDAAAVILGLIAALAVRAGTGGHSFEVDGRFWALLASTSGVAIAVSVSVGLYQPSAARARPHLIFGASMICTVIVAAGFLVADVSIGSVGALGVLFVVVFGADCGLRFAYDLASREWVRRRKLRPLALVLGKPAVARACAKALVKTGQPIQPLAYLSEAEIDDRFCAGTYDDLKERLHDFHIREVVIADSGLSTARKAELVAVAQRAGVNVRYYANEHEITLGAVDRIGDYGFIRAPAALMSPEATELKRFLDLVLVTLTAPAWVSILAFYCVYSRLARPGQPIIATVDRVGRGRSGFTMLRFRTRTLRSDGTRAALPTGRIESLFERTGLDELPQLVNVLRGEMSVVGPRPLDDHDARGLTPTEQRTLNVRPGMTGRWQVSGTFQVSEAAMRAIDTDYLRRWRISHDVDLVVRTPIAILKRRRYVGDTELRRLRADEQTR